MSLAPTITSVADLREWVEIMLDSAMDHHDQGLTEAQRERDQGKADVCRIVLAWLRELEDEGDKEAAPSSS